MKVARSATARVSRRPVHQIQFDEGSYSYVDQEKTVDLRKKVLKLYNLFGFVLFVCLIVRVDLLPCCAC